MTDPDDAPQPGSVAPLADVPPPPLPSSGPLAEWTATGAIAWSWETVKARPERVLHLFLSMLTANALSTLGSVVDMAILGVKQGSQDVTLPGGVLQILSIPIALWMGVGQARYAIRVARGEDAGLGVLFAGANWRLAPAYLGAALLVGFGAVFGLVLLILPGIILLTGWAFWAQFLVDRGGVMRSLRGSWEMTRRRRIEVFAFLLLMLLVNVLGLMACCVVVIVTAAMTALAIGWSYVRLGDGREFRAPGDGAIVT